MALLGAGQTSIPTCPGHGVQRDPARRSCVHLVGCRGRLDRRIPDCVHNVTGRCDGKVELQRQWTLRDMKGS